MNISVLGINISVLNIIIAMVLGFLIATHTTCSCCKISAREAMTTLINAAAITANNNNYYNLKEQWVDNARNYSAHMDNNNGSDDKSEIKETTVPLENTMFYFKDNEFKPECCPSTYSSSTGCACMSEKQTDYLNERGGNRTKANEL